MEYLQQDYQFIYKFEEKAQRISKSTWFDLKSYDEDTDFMNIAFRQNSSNSFEYYLGRLIYKS